MDISLLKTFLEVNRTRHFGRAAASLFVTQSAVSARIRLLEETIGTPLFTRDRNDIRLTPAGEKLLKHAEIIVSAWNRARQDVAAGQEHKAVLAIGSVDSLWDALVHRWLQEVLRVHPDIAVQVDLYATEALMRRVLDGALDVAFVLEPPALPELVVEPLASVCLCLVSSVAGQPVAMALEGNYVMVDWGTAFASEHARAFPQMPAPALRVGSGRVALQMVLERGGAAYLARSTVEDRLEGGALHQVAGAPVMERPVYAVHSVHSDKRQWLQSLWQYVPSP